ncbi:MAG: Hint domain-containing homing endonuclease [Lachnospiraceae bacterium]|nr:Hint domain-containing homing endonuclease [Lachnospiraceae bacterium]
MENSLVGLEMYREIMGEESIKNIDYSNPEHLQFIYQLCGGEARLRDELPEFYCLLHDMVNLYGEQDIASYKTLMQYPESERNIPTDCIVSAYYSQKESENVLVEAFGNFTQSVPGIPIRYIYAFVKVYQNGVLLLDICDGVDNVNQMRVVGEIPKESLDKEFPLEGYVTYMWADGTTMKTQEQKIENLYTSSIYGYVSDTKLKDPMSKHNRNDVVVTYNRNPMHGEIVDYNYTAGSIDGKDELVLDVSFETTLKDVNFMGVSDKNFFLRADFANIGSAQYKKTDQFVYNNCFSKDGDKVIFKLNPIAWGIPIEFGKLDYLSRMHITGCIPFIVRGIKNTNFYGEVQIMLHETAPVKGEDCRTYPIELLWGCLAAGTQITMADGVTKNISDVIIGDMVLGKDGKADKVINTWTGTEEKELVCIEMENGKRLRCTEGHPIATDRGYVKARELNGSYKLIDENGEYIQICGMYPVVEKKVYNLDIETDEEGGAFFAEGILVGDNAMQNHLNITHGENELTSLQLEMKKLINM